MYAIKNAADYNADYVLIDGDKTYICRLNPGRVDKLSAEPIENQDAWNISLIEKQTTDDGDVVTTKYPNGESSAYNFRASACKTYEYKYQK